MKQKIHPKYQETTITCGCGEVINTRSTGKAMSIEICSKCHPFYSGGGERLVDTAGRIEKFQKRFKIQEGGTMEAVQKTKQARQVRAKQKEVEEKPAEAKAKTKAKAKAKTEAKDDKTAKA